MSAGISIHLFYLGLLIFIGTAAFMAGFCGGLRKPNKTVFISDWPNGSIQWDSEMSQADVLDFLDKVHAHVLANSLAKIENTQDQSSTHDTAQPKEQARD